MPRPSTSLARSGDRIRRDARVALGRHLRALRLRRQLSTLVIAKALGCSRQFVSDLERGLRTTSDATVWTRLARELACDPADLLSKAWQASGWLALPWASTHRAAITSLLPHCSHRDARGTRPER